MKIEQGDYVFVPWKATICKVVSTFVDIAGQTGITYRIRGSKILWSTYDDGLIFIPRGCTASQKRALISLLKWP